MGNKISNKKKFSGVPCDYCLWLGRVVNSARSGQKFDISRKFMKRAQKTFGFSFNKTALKMKDLGYSPKIMSYAVDSFDSMGMGDRTINLPLKPYNGKKK